MKFEVEDFFKRRRQAYLAVFNPENESARIVLEDLTNFCRGDKSTFHPKARVHAVLEGRREVFLRIKEHTDLPLEEFLKRKGKKDDNDDGNSGDE